MVCIAARSVRSTGADMAGGPARSASPAETAVAGGATTTRPNASKAATAAQDNKCFMTTSRRDRQSVLLARRPAIELDDIAARVEHPEFRITAVLANAMLEMPWIFAVVRIPLDARDRADVVVPGFQVPGFDREHGALVLYRLERARGRVHQCNLHPGAGFDDDYPAFVINDREAQLLHIPLPGGRQVLIIKIGNHRGDRWRPSRRWCRHRRAGKPRQHQAARRQYRHSPKTHDLSAPCFDTSPGQRVIAEVTGWLFASPARYLRREGGCCAGPS